MDQQAHMDYDEVTATLPHVLALHVDFEGLFSLRSQMAQSTGVVLGTIYRFSSAAAEGWHGWTKSTV